MLWPGRRTPGPTPGRRPDVIAPSATAACGRRDLADRVLQAPAQVGGHHERCQGGHCDGDSDRQGRGVLVGLLGVHLLVGVVGHSRPVQMLTEQRRSDHRGHHPGGDTACDEDQSLGEQQPLSHAKARRP